MAAFAHPVLFSPLSLSISTLSATELERKDPAFGLLHLKGFRRKNLNSAKVREIPEALPTQVRQTTQVHGFEVTSVNMLNQVQFYGSGNEQCVRFNENLGFREDCVNPNGIMADSTVYSRLLKGCANMKSLGEGKSVHAHMIKTGINADTILVNSLISTYAKCGSVVDARLVFDTMAEPELGSYTAMISCYAQNGQGHEALVLFFEMQWMGIKSNQFTFGSVLMACACSNNLKQGNQVFAHVLKTGYASDVCVGSALVDMYARCGDMVCARQVFDKLPERNVVTWTGMITRYARNEDEEEALKLFQEMQLVGVKPDKFTFASVLGACASLEALDRGKRVHAGVIKNGIELDVCVGSVLIDMYVKCAEGGCMMDAQKLFDRMRHRNVVTWTAIIAGYAQNSGQGEEAVKLFCKMKEAGVKPNQFTFASLPKACASLAEPENGKQIHAHIIKTGYESDICVGNALVTMYSRCGSIEDARKRFDKMMERNMVSWNAMVVGYAQNGHSEEACKLFCQTQQVCMKIDEFTFASVLSACASMAALDQGMQLHACILKCGFESDICVANALVTMYARCGSIEDAFKVFDKMPERNVISWTATITGYAQHGHGKESLQLFEQMLRAGVKPNHITFIGVLSACSHVGLVDEGRQYFDSMNRDHGIMPRVEHYACMVDLLGRAGYLNEAEDFINRMPFEPDALVWRTLLAACRIHGDMELGKRAAECLLELEPQEPATYVLLSNMYAVAGRWDAVTMVRKMMKDRQLTKEAGRSWIEIKNRVHTFFVRDRSHPLTEEIYAMLDKLTKQMKDMGYVPDINFALHDVEEELKEIYLCHHSEKLAIAFGLIVTPPGKAIRIFKNLRVCGDCHTAIKCITKIVEREIVVRDANRFHHFKSGLCSCGDYW